MNQKEFLDYFQYYTDIPKKTRYDLLKNLKSLMVVMVENSDPIIFPFLGKIIVQYQAARVRYDINLDSVIVFPAKNTVKMVRFGAQQQYLYSQYNPQYNYKTFSQYPSGSLGYALRDWTGYDLKTCMDFLAVFVQIILEVCAGGDKVVISRIGTFKPMPIKIESYDPVAPKIPLTGVAVDPVNNVWAAVGTLAEPNACLYSNDALNWSVGVRDGNFAATALCFSPELNIFLGVGGVYIDQDDFMGVLISSDGINWSETITGAKFAPVFVNWFSSGGFFIAAGFDSSDGSMALSADGTSWTMIKDTIFDYITGVAYSTALALYVAVGYSKDGYSTWLSSDGFSWSVGYPDSFSQWGGIIYSEKLELFFAWGDTAPTGFLASSPDGVVWTSVSGSASSAKYPVIGGEKTVQIVLTTTGSGVTDITIVDNKGADFYRNLNLNITARAGAYNPENNNFVLVGNDTTRQTIAFSNGGINWFVSRTSSESPPTDLEREVISYKAAKYLDDKAN